MKIGFDAKRAFHNNRGLGNYSRDIIRIIQEKSENEIVLFNPQKKQDKRINLTEKTKVITPKGLLWKKINSLWRFFCISKITKREKLDIYHGLSGEIPFDISKHTKTVVTIHDLIFLTNPKLYHTFDVVMHYIKFRYAAQKANHIIAISNQTKRDIVKYLGVDEKKISVVYQGCHKAFKKIYSSQEKEIIRKKYDLPERFVLNVGAIEERKNALEVVKAIENLDIDLILVGKKYKYYQRIEKYCKQNNLEQRVRVLEGVTMEELAKIYQLSLVFCYPSITEGFGIPIVEALFCGVPVITTKGGCFQEAAGEDSLFVDISQNTHKQIEKHIKTILEDEHLKQKMILKGRQHAEKFTDDEVFKNVNSVYEKIKQQSKHC